MSTSSHEPKTDIVGIISSTLCLIHCIAGPLLVLLGVSVQFHEGEHWHIWELIFMAVSAWAVWRVTRLHSPQFVKLGLWISLGVLGVSLLLGHDFGFFEYLGWMAAGGLVVFHILNIRHSHTCSV